MKKSLAGLSVVLYSITVAHAAALGSAFTYQGRLTDGGNPATGIYDLRFAIYDAPTGGDPVANAITHSTVGVTNGLFNTELDFGANAFLGEARWLEISVRSAGGTNAFTALDPRQRFAPIPYALYAPAAGTAAAATTVASGGVINSSLAPNSVTSDKIANATITANHLAPAILNGEFWRLNGNTNTTPGTHFLGTTDPRPLELRVNGVPALRLTPGGTNGAPNVIGGSSLNAVGFGVSGSTIAGGGTLDWYGSAAPNRITADFGTIAGGIGNIVSGDDPVYAGSVIGGGMRNAITNSGGSVIGGGGDNRIDGSGGATIAGGSANRIEPSTPAATISGGAGNRIGTNGWWSTIGGGSQNTMFPEATYSTIGGGVQNRLGGSLVSATIAGGAFNKIDSNAWHATISGGRSNTIVASAHAATIPGGSNNVVRGVYGFAAGQSAHADHPGSFVWADSAGAIFASTATNQFAVRAGGGVRLETSGAGMTLDGRLVLSGSVTGAQLADNSVGGAKIVDGSVSNNDISDTANISASKIADGAGSGLDADLLDGLDSSAFAAAAHQHDAFYWRLTGNAGTTPGTHFIGTTDNQTFELRVNNERGLRLEPGGSNSVNVIGGWAGNGVAPGTVGATVAGGGAGNYFDTPYSNRVEAHFGTLSGGAGNRIQTNADYAAIGGGYVNTVQRDAYYAAISGGYQNMNQAPSATIGGGAENWIQPNARNATISGGWLNTIQTNGGDATIGGGRSNWIQSDAGSTTIGGGTANWIQSGAFFATIGGGQFNTIQSNAQNAIIGGGEGNSIAPGAFYAIIAGGFENKIGNNADYTTIAGGWRNTIEPDAFPATIGGGQANMIQTNAQNATIGGGAGNWIQPNAYAATIGGGWRNSIQADANYATIPGGLENSATNFAFAAGHRATANHTGAFVWADSSDLDFPSTTTNEFAARATGGVRFVSGIDTNGAPSAGVSLPAGSGSWTSLSDRNVKTDFTPVNPRDFLERVAQLPVQSWRYKTEAESICHVGPMAQDFHAAFGLGADDKHIATVDADGVTLAAIQGLNQKLEQTVKQKDVEIQALKTQLAKLEQSSDERDARLVRLEKAIEAGNGRMRSRFIGE